MGGQPPTQPIGTDLITEAGRDPTMKTLDQDLTLDPIMDIGVVLTMETMGVVMDLTMGNGGAMMITGVELITETMDLTTGDGVIMMTMTVDLTTEIMALTLEIMALTMTDGEIMRVDLPMEIMALITTAGEVAQAIGETTKQRTIGAIMETHPLTQISYPPPPWKN